MPKIQNFNNRLSLTLPQEIARIKGWSKGDSIYFSIEPKTGEVVLSKV